jgi:hypothetical protein
MYSVSLWWGGALAHLGRDRSLIFSAVETACRRLGPAREGRARVREGEATRFVVGVDITGFSSACWSVAEGVEDGFEGVGEGGVFFVEDGGVAGGDGEASVSCSLADFL